jgi:hypothetical protein
MYKEKLDKGQVKRGAIDISNASTIDADYGLSVKLFRQVDSSGRLEFYENPDVTKGISLDISDISLKAKEVARVVFSVDSAKLPEGDIFAVIFVETKHAVSPQAIVPAAQVGTLLVLENGKPGPRDAEISSLELTEVQTGDEIKGAITVKNPAQTTGQTGFFPDMKVTVEPWGSSKQFSGPLIYAGNARTFDFSVPSNQFGIFKLTVSANGASESQYVFLATGQWKAVPIIVLVIALAIAGLLILWRLRIRKKRVKKGNSIHVTTPS